MRKIWLLLIGITIAFSTLSMQFNAGDQYITLDKPVTDEPQILEFFSFYCPHCYQFEQMYHVSENVKKYLPTGNKITRYHVDFLGPLGKMLTQAWAIAIAMDMEDTVIPLMFEAVQKNHAIQNADDIRNVFVRAGMIPEYYDVLWNSFIVKSLLFKQEKAAKDLQVQGVPSVFINGKYMIKNDSLKTRSIAEYVQQFSDVVKFLMNDHLPKL